MAELDVLKLQELELARKIFWLLANDYIFLSGYNNDTDSWDGGGYPAINCNDIFVPGADAEGLDSEHIDLYIEACKQFNDDATYAWCSVMRNAKPWRNRNLLNKEAVAWISERLKNENKKTAPYS